jgi:DHA1 family tetracycline resistance protein-like MFS transporter
MVNLKFAFDEISNDANKTPDTFSNMYSEQTIICGVPSHLFVLYCSYVLDSISIGLVMPLLPFFAMELGASAFQLSLVVSSNYVAQMVGCIAMGQISDTFGRRNVLIICLAASSVQYILVSYSQTLIQLSLARIVSGCFIRG